MPTPPRTSLDAIVRAGRAILDAEGVEALTMQRVATAVGVRAPSLYKRVRDRDALVRLIAADVLAELGATLNAAAATGDASTDLSALLVAFRRWAHGHPGGFDLVFARVPDAWRPDPESGGAALEAVFGTVAALAGPGEVLEASRMLVAWAAGFVSMELAGAFRLGGNVDTAFEYGAGRLAQAISTPGKDRPGSQ